MYPHNQEGKKERRKDIERLWQQLQDKKIVFSEHLEWFGKKAEQSDASDRFEMMWEAYLAILIRVDNSLFLGRAYWDITDKQLDRAYSLLMRGGYAERLIELALGVAKLSAQTRCNGHFGNTGTMRELAERYREELEQHRQALADGAVDRDSGWELFRRSNQFFAEIFDTVERGTRSFWRRHKYVDALWRLDDYTYGRVSTMDAYKSLVYPSRYKAGKIMQKVLLKDRNRRKRMQRYSRKAFWKRTVNMMKGFARR